jgi:hypothetical protein
VIAKTERVTRHESETPDWHIARPSKPSKFAVTRNVVAPLRPSFAIVVSKSAPSA